MPTETFLPPAQYSLPVFENLCPSWNQILFLGIRRAFPRGTQIFDPDQPLNGIYLVVEGSIEVILFTHSGPTKALFYVGPGSPFGEVSCFVSGDSGEAYALARTDCVLYFFPLETIEGTIAVRYPSLMVELVRSCAHKIRTYTVQLKDSQNGDHFVRVCKMLIYLARYKGIDIENGQPAVQIEPGMTQNELARLMGIHRVTFTKAVGRLKQMGIVERYSKARLVITDLPALCRLAGGGDFSIPPGEDGHPNG